MSEHVALFVDRLVASTAAHGGDSPVSIGRASFSAKKAPPSSGKARVSHQKSSSSMLGKDEVEPHRIGSKNPVLDCSLNIIEDISKCHLVAAAGECRICQEEDDIINLEAPCACMGSLKFAHHACVQQWCNEKGDTVCEICRMPYEGEYTAPPPSTRADGFTINIGGRLEGDRLNLHDTRLFSVASEHHFLDSDYEEYARVNSRSAACFRAVAFLLMILLLLRHVSSMTTSTVAEDDVSSFLVIFFLRAAGFFLPCYIMTRALNMLHCRRQRREAALAAAAEVAYLFQSGQAHGVPVSISVDQ